MAGGHYRKRLHKDTNNCYKCPKQEKFVVDMVVDWWDIVYPVGKLELYGEILARYDCTEDTGFYNNYLDKIKISAVMGLFNLENRFLKWCG